DTEHVGSSIDIVDNSHFITSIFPLGALPIYAADMEILTADPALAGGLQILGELSGAASLTAIDQGAATTSGTAAGRRVTLPLGRHFASDFNWMHLNNNGRLIVQRAIEWGMSNDKGAAGNLLMVVANPANLNPQDSSKKTLIESWSYTVNLIDDGDSQTNIDTAAAANDVIYVSASISGGALADKLSASLTPIVNEFAGKLDNFGFSSNTDGTVTTNTFTATNVSHHIGKPFAGGGVIHFTSSLVMPVPSGTLAPGLNSAASTGGMTWALPTLDAGAEAWDGLPVPVPARRVHLPFGAAQSSQLTDDGKILMRRALEWAVMPPLPLLPIAHWKLDETVGFSAVDSEGGHDGGLANGPSWAGGFHDGALQFDGNDDTVVVAHDDTLSLTEAFTFAAWINADTVGGPSAYQAVLTKGSTSAHNYWFGLLGTEVTLEFQVGGTWYDFVTSGIGLAPGNWYHIAATFDNFSNRVRLYLNGVEMLTDTMTATPQVNGENVLIGSSAFGGEGWPGLLDDVRIYDRALSDQEIAELAMVPQKLPIAHWKLDDTAGTVAIDSVGGNDGTLINWPASPDWVPGLLDGGLSFDGVNDYIDVSSMNPMSYDDFTIIAWYKSADMSLSDDEYIFMHGNGFVDALTFGPTDDGGETLRLATYVSDVTDRHYGTSDIVDQQWHHLVAVRSGGRIKLYVDGVKETDEVDAYAGITINVDGDGPFIGDYPGVTEQVHGTLDDVRFYDLGLDDTEIADLFAAGGGGGPGYTELYQPWSATADGSWQTVDLGAFGVPADAVVEVAVVNSGTRREYFGGVRAVGSSLERRFRLHEAEGGGVDTVTLHVQADASSQIEHYSDRRNRVSFVVLGFWADATYVERFDAFKAGANASWQPHNLGPYGVGSNQVAEISISQTSTSIEWLVGARRPGSGLARRISLHEAEDGGIDMVTLMAGTDASSIVEVYAEANSVVDFHLLGYWSTPPGSYIETGGVHGQATVAGSWLTTDLSSFGVPANSIAQFVMSNERDGQENQMGLRETGSTIPNRRLDLQEAESGGGDLGTMHVRVDASSQIQWSAEYGATEGFFYPVGWWVLSP
ncbi:MAG: LamG domain-containing protein, partial [Gammaproteobacteria bacterium]|nr:LamG domain-containing protein [Gammaproteobacteria bacterium]